MPYELFESEMKEGFHLEFFQILNWGLFDKQVYTLRADSRSTLLTGENGSGKTTLVDALTTLLVPSGLRFYNQSSGSTRKKDRSEESYVLGAYGNIQASDSLSGSTKYLREKEDVFSILNGCFYDQSTRRTLTLLQVRYFTGTELQRVFAITESRLSVEDMTSLLASRGMKFDRAGKWKKLLASGAGTVFYDSFEKYKSFFIERMGFRSDKALKLFSQIVGLKVLGNLTEFIRENMLEKADADTEFQKLERNYENLLQSERTILKTQKQLELLEPVIQTGRKLQDATEEKDRLKSLSDAVPVWRTERGISLLHEQIEELEREIKAQEETKTQKASESQALESAIRSLQADIDNTASARRISEIESEMRNLEGEKERRKAEASRYGEKASLLGIEIPSTRKQFEKNQALIAGMAGELQKEKDVLDKKKTQASVDLAQNEALLQDVTGELASLGKRNSNIPEKNVRIRSEICKSLGEEESGLPFAGELLQVKRGEEKWNAAIEKLLHNFALTILVPERLYKLTTNYVKDHDMKGRVVYLRTSGNSRPALEGYDVPDTDSVPGKVQVRQDHALATWLEACLAERFDYRCTDDTQEIARADKALSSSGLIKNGIRHEKDDRHPGGRAEFVLGWDNTQKKMALSRQLDELEGKDRELKGSLQKLQSSQDAMEKKLFAVQSLQELDSWDKLDFASVARTIDTLSDERRKLAASKDIRQKQEMLDQKKEEKRRADSEKEQVIKTLGKFENQLSTAQSSLSQHERTWQAFLALPDFEQTAARAVESLCGEYPRLTKAATMQDADDAGGKMQRELNGKMDTAQRSINGFTTALQAAMSEVKSPNAHLREQFGDWAGEFSDMGTSKEFLPDYQNFYDKLLKDDLPRYRRQFHEFLHNSVRDDIINFNQFIGNAREDIENAVQYLNQNLRAITYQRNPDTYLSLKCDRAKDPRIDEFNRKLRAAIPDAARIQMQDYEYEEQLFGRIKSFLESMKQNENVRSHVLDIRNWYTFAASENYVQDNTQKQYYPDSASLSGGEKAKLTYTILASAISYQFGISEDSKRSFRFVIIDEAFSKSDSTNSEYAMKLFKQLDLQVMVITPLDKINIVEDYISSVHMTENKGSDDSRLLSMTIQEYREKKQA